MLFPELDVSISREGDEPQAPLGDRILNCDALAGLKRLPSGIAHCLVTSPPYFGQRDYGHEQQLGEEDTPEEYVERLVAILGGARRVLRPDGAMWLNLGDKYLDGELLGMPWRVALALKGAGWLLRSDIIWHKPNAMPSSVKNRPTTDHEYVFLFAMSEGYYFDGDSIREPHKTFSAESKMKGGRAHFGIRGGTPEIGKNSGNQNLHTGRWDQAFHPLGRSKRTVWSVPLSKFRGAHFAVFPEKLIEPCILSTSRPRGIVLDPFFGSGTTGVVARKLNRRFVGIELNSDYCELARGRLA